MTESTTPRTDAEPWKKSDLPAWDALLNHARELERELAAARQSLSESIDSPRWILATERMPEPMTHVLAVERQRTGPFVPVVAYYNTRAGRHLLATAWIDSAGDYIDVTHWMPLPEAPK